MLHSREVESDLTNGYNEESRPMQKSKFRDDKRMQDMSSGNSRVYELCYF